MRNERTIQALILASASLLAAAAAHAQDVQTAPTAPVQATDAAPDTVIVTGRRTTNGAIAARRNAINLVNIQSAEDIVKYPDFNAAESLSRIPGVTISADTGEGRFVVIRGIDSNLNGTTFGGVTLLNTQPRGVSFGGGGRATELDTIPIGGVDQLLVRKTGIPDQEAEGLGGSVDIIPRTAQGIKKPFVEGTIGGGYQPAHGHAGVYRAELAAGTRFGPDKAFGIEVNGNYHEDGRGFDDVEPGPLETGPKYNGNQVPSGPGDTALDSVDLRRYNYNRRRFGLGAELTFDPGPQSHYYLRADDAGYTERVNRQVSQYRNLGTTAAGNTVMPDASGTFVADAATARRTIRDEQETALNFVTAFGGHNDLGKIIVDYQGSYTAATYHRDYDYNSTFTRPNPGLTVTYRPGGGIDGLPSLTPGNFDPTTPDGWTLSRFTNSSPEGAHDREWAGRLDVTVPVHLIGEDETIKIGGKLKLRDKRDTQHKFDYFGFAGATPLPTVSLAQLLGPGPYSNFYNGQYAIGYQADYLSLRKLIPDNKQRVAPQVTDKPIFNDTENIYAGFIQYQGKIGKLGYLAGVRIENTDGTYRSPDQNKENYTDFFPTVQLRYDATDKLVLRATYSTAISRPGFNQLVNGDVPDLGNLTVAEGSPNLKPIKDDAFDLSAEYYLPHAGILSIGLFDKEFQDYILNTLTFVNDDPRLTALNNGMSVGRSSITANRNVGGAYARGIEVQYEQRFKELPGILGGLGFSGNVTYVHSHIKIRNADQLTAGSKDQFAGLPGTSELTWNVAGFYEKGGFTLRVSAQNAGPSIFGVGSGPGLDTYTDDKTQVDLDASYDVNRHATVYFQAKNLSNGALRYYEGYQNRVVQREFYDASYEAGVRFKF